MGQISFIWKASNWPQLPSLSFIILVSGTRTVAFRSQLNSPNLYILLRKLLNCATFLCPFGCFVAHQPPVPQRFLMWAGWQRTFKSTEARLVRIPSRSLSPQNKRQELLSPCLLCHLPWDWTCLKSRHRLNSLPYPLYYNAKDESEFAQDF